MADAGKMFAVGALVFGGLVGVVLLTQAQTARHAQTDLVARAAEAKARAAADADAAKAVAAIRDKSAALERACRLMGEEQARRDARCLEIRCPGNSAGAYAAAAERPTVGIGWDACLARASMGRPVEVNRTVTAYGTHEQWIYPGEVYVYVDDDRVTSWQD
jgi:type II secretory pathway component PulJ